MRRRDLGMVLLGVLLAVAAFGVRAAFLAFQELSTRVSYIEGYLAMLDKIMRSAQ